MAITTEMIVEHPFVYDFKPRRIQRLGMYRLPIRFPILVYGWAVKGEVFWRSRAMSL